MPSARLRPARDVPTARRLRALALLRTVCDDDAVCREVEAAAHAASVTADAYADHLARAAHNMRQTPHNWRPEIVLLEDDALLRGTLLERIRAREAERRVRFEQMLQEKVDGLGAADDLQPSSLRCRRCESVDVSWEQKQTRSADEPMTVFFVCATCHNRWTVR